MSKSWISGLKSTAAALAVCAMVTPANAHVIIEGFEGRANYNEFLNLMVPHGCGLLDTTEVRMKIPASVPLFAPEQKDGWETELVMRKLDEPIKRGNQTITEVYDEVIWRGNLPALHLGVFKFLARITGPIDSVVPFKVIQTCGDKEDRWVDVVDDGEPGWKMWALEAPAPFVVVVEGDGPQLGASMQDIGAERQRLGSATKQ
ncbi:MAG: YcnI family protein [Rhodospirillaceae bacterium]